MTLCKKLFGKNFPGRESEQRDSNPRPTAPKAVALAKLRYAPISDRDFNHPAF